MDGNTLPLVNAKQGHNMRHVGYLVSLESRTKMCPYVLLQGHPTERFATDV